MMKHWDGDFEKLQNLKNVRLYLLRRAALADIKILTNLKRNKQFNNPKKKWGKKHFLT